MVFFLSFPLTLFDIETARKAYHIKLSTYIHELPTLPRRHHPLHSSSQLSPAFINPIVFNPTHPIPLAREGDQVLRVGSHGIAEGSGTVYLQVLRRGGTGTGWRGTGGCRG
jgi:hypothetical protein